MQHDLEPALSPVKIVDLRPTQMTVGFGEVALKREAWRARREQEGPEYLGRHLLPVVIGPGKRRWLVDHHHLACALHAEGETHVLTNPIADLSHLGKQEFLTAMDNRIWLHPFDHGGKRCSYNELPKSIRKMKDDPYRSLAGALRRVGGYAKSPIPFTEFLWADFLRHRIHASLVHSDFDGALTKAVRLSHSGKASFLPGWVGLAAA